MVSSVSVLIDMKDNYFARIVFLQLCRHFICEFLKPADVCQHEVVCWREAGHQNPFFRFVDSEYKSSVVFLVTARHMVNVVHWLLAFFRVSCNSHDRGSVSIRIMLQTNYFFSIDSLSNSIRYAKRPKGPFHIPGRLPGIEPELSVPQTDALTVIL